MNPAWRATALLADPNSEWPKIGHESGDAAFLLSRYAAVLAVIPAIFDFIGATVIGAVSPGMGTVRAPLFDGVFGAVFGYVATIAAVLILGLVIDLLAPAFEGEKDFDSALKLAVYSFTPVWLAGVFLILPGLRFLTLTGLYGAYLLAVGLPRLMKSPPHRTPLYAFTVVVCASALLYAAAAVQRAVFGIAGL